MGYDFDSIIERRNTSSVKWDFINEVFDRNDVLPMWVADMDFAAPPEVTKALRERANHNVYGYTLRPMSYFESIIYWIKTKHNWDINKEWIASSPGVVPALGTAVLSYTVPRDKIIIQTPVYHPFFTAIEGNGREIVLNNLKYQNGRYEMDFEDLESKIDSGVKMIILSNPHNPIGRVWSREELQKLGNICLKNNIVIVSDEIHSDIIYEGYKHTPMASISKEIGDITLTCMAPSKTFNIAGLSTSYIIIPNGDLLKKFNETMDALGIGSGNVFGITALEAAYVNGEEWVKELIEYLQGNIDFMTEYFRKNISEIKFTRPEGTYLAWLDCKDLGMDAEKLKEFMIHEARVGLNEGREFGRAGEGFMRLNFGCPRSMLKEGLERIRTAVEKRR